MFTNRDCMIEDFVSDCPKKHFHYLDNREYTRINDLKKLAAMGEK